MICVLYFEEVYCFIICLWRSGTKFTKLFLEETENTPTFNSSWSLIRFKLEIIFFHGSLDPIIDDYHDGGNTTIIMVIVANAHVVHSQSNDDNLAQP